MIVFCWTFCLFSIYLLGRWLQQLTDLLILTYLYYITASCYCFFFISPPYFNLSVFLYFCCITLLTHKNTHMLDRRTPCAPHPHQKIIWQTLSFFFDLLLLRYMHLLAASWQFCSLFHTFPLFNWTACCYSIFFISLRIYHLQLRLYSLLRFR